MTKRTNYIRGRDKEYRIVKTLKSQGYIAFRSAGSHSPFDVVAINPDTKLIILVQSKLRGKKNLSKVEREIIENEKLLIEGDYKVLFELWE
jgi:Holliday junction resolvase